MDLPSSVCTAGPQPVTCPDMPEDMPDGVPEDMPEDMPDRVPEDMPDRVPEDVPEGMPDKVPECLPDRMPDKMSDRMPEDMPDKVPEFLPDRMPEDMLVTKRINVCVSNQSDGIREICMYVVMALANTKMTQDPIGHYR